MRLINQIKTRNKEVEGSETLPFPENGQNSGSPVRKESGYESDRSGWPSDFNFFWQI